MSINTFLFAALAAFTTVAHAQVPQQTPDERPVQVSFARGELSDVLRFYRTLTGRTVWLELGVDAHNVSVVSERPLPRAAALSLIRRTLLDTYGIDIREEGDRAFVTRVSTPSPSPRP
jgi:type II secretory pathway component GspD/PulD (secretin)